MIQQEACATYEKMGNPSVLYRPHLSIDGDQWCALYGENLQDGVAGFGSSPYEAMLNFDENWYRKLNIKAKEK
jgi:hypothetical protein